MHLSKKIAIFQLEIFVDIQLSICPYLTNLAILLLLNMLKRFSKTFEKIELIQNIELIQ